MRQSKLERISIALCLILIAGFLGASVLSYLVSSRSVRDHITASQLPLTGDNVYSELQKDIIRPVYISTDMAKNTFLRDWLLSGETDNQEITRYLSEVKTQNNTVTAFLVSERTRVYYHAEGPLKTVQEAEPRDSWYFRVKALDTDFETNVDPDLANGDETTIFINHRVLDFDGNFIGVTGVGLTLLNVQKQIDYYEEKYSSKVYFINDTGLVTLAGTAAGNVGKSIHASSSGIQNIAEQILENPHEQKRLDYRSEAGARIQVNSRFVPELDWHLVLEYDESAAVGPFKSMLKVNVVVGAVATLLVLAILLPTIRRYVMSLNKAAYTDTLTGLLNRQGLTELVNRDLVAAGNSKQCSVIYFDIDNFKRINDTYGHATGDAVLTTVAKRAVSVLRESDLISRWGGEEFVVVLPGGDMEDAKDIAERIRSVICEHEFQFSEKPVTVSIGVSDRSKHESLDQMLQQADTALYMAKNSGKNQVVTWLHAVSEA